MAFAPDELLRQTRYDRTVTDPKKLEPCTAEVTFVGRSNVGKSSVLNALCQQKQLARTSPLPGKTRTINVYKIDHRFCLVDLPGYGFATGPASEREQWQDMIEGYLTGRPSLRMIFVLIDAEVGPTKLDLQMIEWLRYQGLPRSIIATKIDKVKPGRQEARKNEIGEQLGFVPSEISWVSASKNIGIKELRAKVVKALESK